MSSSPPITSISVSSLSQLLTLTPTSPLVSKYLQTLSPTLYPSSSTPTSIKSYPEAQYHTYLHLGLDIIYSPSINPNTSLEWNLDRIDIYNPIPGIALPGAGPGSSRRRAPPPYSPPALPIVIQLARTAVLPPKPEEVGPMGSKPLRKAEGEMDIKSSQGESIGKGIGGRPERFLISKETTGREFVDKLGEPSRKGGAQGWVGPWLEWSNLRILKIRQGEAGSSKEISSIGGDAVGHGRDEKEEEEEIGIGLMVELRPTQRGPTEEEQKKGMGGIWDQAASWEWSCTKVFKVGGTI